MKDSKSPCICTDWLASFWLISLLKRTGVEKENEGVKRSLCLLRNVFVDVQAESKVFSVLVCYIERKGVGEWVPVEMGILALRGKPCHLCVSESV